MKRHETKIRVRYEETDNMGVVYYAKYFVWFEVARTEYFRALGISYRQMEEKGIYLMVASTSCAYKHPARYDDIVTLRTWIPKMKNTSLRFEYELLVGDKVIATGDSVHVFTNEKGRPIRIPIEVKELSINSCREDAPHTKSSLKV